MKELVRTPVQRICAGVIDELSNAGELGATIRSSLTSNEVPLGVVKELVTIPLQRINAGPSGQSGALLTVSAVVLMSHRMQNSNRPFELSWLREVPLELVKELSKTPLGRSKAGDLGESGRVSLTSN